MRTRDSIAVVLKILGLAGLAGTTIVAPNALQALSALLKKTAVKKSDYQKVMKDLKRQGLVHTFQERDSVTFSLTPAGAHRLQQIMVDELEIPKPTKWDKRWRLISFDIPVKYSRQRLLLTKHLQGLGLAMLQRSLWVHPFPCFEQVQQLAGHYNVLRYCAFMEVSRVDSLSAKRLSRLFASLLHG